MKFAMPSDDQVTLAAHTGRTKGFLVYESAGEECVQLEYRLCSPENPCDGSGHHNHSHEPGHGDSRHDQLMSVLRDCDAVVALGMGPRLQQVFAQNQIQVYFTRDRSAERVAKQMSTNAIQASDRIKPCAESHGHN